MEGTGVWRYWSISTNTWGVALPLQKNNSIQQSNGSGNPTSGSSNTHNTQQSNASKQHSVQQGAKQAKQQG
jgi:hypothetical protein